jgi:hypothetical protein
MGCHQTDGAKQAAWRAAGYGLDFAAYSTRGIRLERTQTLAGGARHRNFRFSRLTTDTVADRKPIGGAR